jgi:aldehyde:ferredoxin oxidoreductase
LGERINTLTRAFKVREGLTGSDDILPERTPTEPLKVGLPRDMKVLPFSLPSLL